MSRTGVNLQFRLVFFIYLSGGTISFFLISWVIADILRIISKQIECLNDKKLASERLDQWQQCFSLLGHFVKQISSCFSFFILVCFIFIFIRLINESFTLLTEIRKDTETDPINWFVIVGALITILWPSLGFILLSYGPNRIQQEVSG